MDSTFFRKYMDIINEAEQAPVPNPQQMAQTIQSTEQQLDENNLRAAWDTAKT